MAESTLFCILSQHYFIMFLVFQLILWSLQLLILWSYVYQLSECFSMITV